MTTPIRTADRDDLLKLVRSLWGCGWETVSDIAIDTGLSSQRIRALANRYSDVRFKALRGRMVYQPGATSSHAKASPGITNHAVGTSGYSPAYIFIAR